MKQKVLNYLIQQEGYVSGQDISRDLGVSRTSVWKCIKGLRQEGYRIESMTRRGYRFISRPDTINEQEIRRHLKEGVLPGEILVLPVVDSINEEAKRAFHQGCPDRSLFVSDRQTAGKGRRGREWISPGGKDVFFSFLLKPDLPPECASMLTLLCAIAGVGALKRQAAGDYQIKWPNDIVLGGKKICGILTEMSADMDRVHYIIPGIGFNLNRTDFDPSIRHMASSVYLETGREIDRSRFVADYVNEFMGRYDIFLRDQDLGSFVDEYQACLVNVGREVKISLKDREMTRTALGINNRGELLVKDAGGRISAILSGEVSVRGLYGYV